MRNLLALFGLAVIGFAGIGWYMGWYKLSYTRTTDGQLQINTIVDTNKTRTDASEAYKNVTAVVGNQVEKAAQDTTTATPNTPAGAVAPPQVSPNPTVPGTLPVAPQQPTAPTPIPLKAPK